MDYDYMLLDDYVDIGDIDIDIPDIDDLPDVDAELMDEVDVMDEADLGMETMDEPAEFDEAATLDEAATPITYEGLEAGDTGEPDFDVPVQPMDEFTYEAMDQYLHQSDFTISNDEMMDFSYDALQYEGAMDINDMSDFQSFDFGDFDPPGMDFDAPDVYID
jgi:hypothetical protein